jgi:2-haloacid dehalogenase
MAECSIAVDLGGVLIDWNPRYLYRKLFDGDPEAMEEFLATVCTESWNEQQDAGRPFADACASLKLVHPHKAELIDAWVRRYDEMLAGPISGTVDISHDAKFSQRSLICAWNQQVRKRVPSHRGTSSKNPRYRFAEHQ